MDYHHHARLTIYSREQLAKSVVEGRLSLREAAAERGLSRQSASKWVRRYRVGGPVALRDRSSRPLRSPRRVAPELIERVERLRRERWTGVRIAQTTGLSRATVSRILTRLKLNKSQNAGAADSHRALRARHPRRHASHRHQEAGPHRQSPATASPAIPRTKPAAPVGSSSTWPSTITPASPSPP